MVGVASGVRTDTGLSGAAAVLGIAERMAVADALPVEVWADDDLVEAVARWDAVEAIAAAQKQRMMAEMADRMVADAEPLVFPRPDGTVRRETSRQATSREIGWCAAEFAPVLRLSQYSTKQRVEESIHMVHELTPVWAALNRGAFSRIHERVFRDELAGVQDQEIIDRILCEYLDAASGYTPAELREALYYAVLKADPEAAARRHRWSRSNRYVTAEAVEDAMGLLRARLTVEELTAVMAVIDAYARLAPPDDPRSLDQRRADVLVDLVTGGLPHNPQHDTDDAESICLPNTPPPDLTDASDEEVVAAFVDRLAKEAADSTTEHTTEPAAEPAGEAAAEAAAEGAAEPAPASEPEPPAGDCACGCGCGGRRDPFAGAAFGLSSRVSAQIKVIVGAGTLLGFDDQPGYLAGHGPIPADIARRLAADSTWSRILTDPDTSELIDAGRTTYRPSAHQREHILTRDLTCRVFGCRSRIVEIDHIIPYPTGDTVGINLAGDCKFHHLWKTFSGITVHMDPDGTCTWTTRTGRRYQTKPPPIGGVCPPTTTLPPAKKPTKSVFDEEPPF